MTTKSNKAIRAKGAVHYLYAVCGLEGGPAPPTSSARFQYECVLAIIEEYHPRDRA